MSTLQMACARGSRHQLPLSENLSMLPSIDSVAGLRTGSTARASRMWNVRRSVRSFARCSSPGSGKTVLVVCKKKGTIVSKITTLQLERKAMVYVRQSSPGQVRNNPESGRRQHGFLEESPSDVVRTVAERRKPSGV